MVQGPLFATFPGLTLRATYSAALAGLVAGALKELRGHGRRSKLPRLRRDYDAQWELLQMYELWGDERVLLANKPEGVLVSKAMTDRYE
jgi:hypothetical protein